MDLLGASINAAVVAVVGIVLAWLAKGRFDAIDQRLDRLEARFDGLEARFDTRIDAMRSDLTQVALAVGVRPRAQND